MPEIKRNFSAGKMNKDFDERLVPNGEYRSALNVEVTTTASGEIGTVKNVQGNTLVNAFSSNGLSASQIQNIFTNTHTVGSIPNEPEDTYFWFTTEKPVKTQAFNVVGILGAGGTAVVTVNSPGNEDFFDIPCFKSRNIIFQGNTGNQDITPTFVDVWQQTRSVDYDKTTTQNDGWVYFNNNSNSSGVTAGLEVGMRIVGLSYVGGAVNDISNVIGEGCKILEIDPVNNCVKPTNVVYYNSIVSEQPPVMIFEREKVLGFSRDILITGVNIIDNKIFWTDNRTEPKKINITNSINETHFSCDKHTNIFNEKTGETFPAKESHLTVVRKSPAKPPRVEVTEGVRGGVITAFSIFKAQDEDSYQDITISSGALSEPNFKVNDFLLFDSTANPGPSTWSMKAKIISISPNTSTSIKARIKIINYLGPNGNVTIGSLGTYYCTVENSIDSIFELKFARFGYRYKYINNEFSCFSPFTDPIFYPSTYLYSPVEGKNKGMKNSIKELLIKDLVLNSITPKDVVQIDILYKDDSSPNVYSIDTIRPDENGPSGTPADNDWNNGYYKIRTENIYAALPSNQILRPFDNVPRYAKSQEVAANRLIYGNYVQNYDMENQNQILKPQLNVGFEKRTGDWFYADGYGAVGRKSLKSIRTYELGVVYLDEHGRQTPVFTSSNASVSISQDESINSNALFSELKSQSPSFAKAFRIFVKETSNEYYNLSLDRIYDATDGCVWLSFASAEINKVILDDYLIFKKKPIASSADSQVLASEEAKCRVLAIEDSAPDFIKTDLINNGVSSGLVDITDLFKQSTISFHPDEEGIEEIVFDRFSWEDSGGLDIAATLESDSIRFSDFNSNILSTSYDIETIVNDFIGVEEVYKIRLKRPLTDNDAAWITDNGTALTTGVGGAISMISSLKVHLYKKDIAEKPEFDGKFFVKIQSNNLIEDQLKPLIAGGNLSVTATLSSFYFADKWAPKWKGDASYTSDSWPLSGEFAGMNLDATGFDSHTDLHNGSYTTEFCTNSDGSATHGHQVSHRIEDWILLLDNPGDNDSKWFIDQAYYAMNMSMGTSNSTKNPSTYQYGHGFGKGIYPNMAGDKATMELSFAGIYHDPTSTWSGSGNPTNPTAWSVGEYNNQNHNEESYITTKLIAGSTFRFAEDPEGIIYEIEDVIGPTRRVNHTSLWEARGWRKNDSLSNDENKFDGKQRIDWDSFNGGANHVDPGNGTWVSMAGHGANAKNRVWNNFVRFTDAGNYAANNHGYAFNSHIDYTQPGHSAKTHPYFQSLGLASGVGEAGAPGGSSYPGSDFVLHYQDNATPTTTNNGYFPNAGDTMADHMVINEDTFKDSSNRRITWALKLDKNPLAQTFNPIAGGNSSSMEPISIQFVEPATSWDSQDVNTNAAVFETEPKVNADLDIYYEASENIPTHLNDESNHLFAPIGSIVTSDDKYHASVFGATIGDPVIPFAPCTASDIAPCNDTVVKVGGWKDNVVYLEKHQGGAVTDFTMFQDAFTDWNGSSIRDVELKFYKPLDTHTDDGSNISGSKLCSNDAWVSSKINLNIQQSTPGVNASSGEYVLNRDIHTKRHGLSWYNCFSWNNGVESDRIRDDYNATALLNGVKASSITLEPYQEERRTNGLIYSGLYNSNSAVNNLNQFIMAESITKDLNPDYGSIQKLFTRDTDLISFCEDRVLKVLANKDALYNAGGEAQLTASDTVLGQAVPFSGDYGISKNPESFATDSYRCYFSDKQRGTILRLSRDGLTPISDYGMKSWFNTNLRIGDRILGSYDSVKREYNLSIADGFEEVWKYKYLQSGPGPAEPWDPIDAF